MVDDGCLMLVDDVVVVWSWLLFDVGLCLLC